MSRVLVLSPAAREDLARIGRWLSQPGSGSRARARRHAIGQAIAGLTLHPCRYPIHDHPGIRERPFEGHRLMYRVTPDTGDDRTAGDVEIVRVFGPGQSRVVLG